MSVTVVLISVFTTIKAFDEYEELESRCKMQQNYASIVYKTILKDISSELEAKANLIIGDERIQKAFAAKNREELIRQTQPFFDKYKYTYRLMAFVGKDNVHFLRLHDKAHYGDNISGKREIIADINRNPRPIYSFEPTLYGLNFIYLAPVYHNGEYLGFFQIGADAVMLQKKLDYYLSAKTAILFDAESMNKFGQNSEKKIGNFYVVSYNDPFFLKIPNNFSFEEQVLQIEEQTMNITEHTITDYKARPIAKMVVGIDVQDEINGVKNSIFWTVTLSLPILFLIFAVLRYAFGELLRQIAKNEEELKHRLYYDSLTSLPNRFALNEELKNEGDRYLALINIDSFKEINDLYGFETGDFVLLELAKRVRNYLSKKVLLYKLSGDEFAVLGDSSDKFLNEDGMLSLLSAVVKEPIFYEDNKILVSMTIGASRTGVMEQADMALKQAKKIHLPYLEFSKSLEIAKEYENNIKWSIKLKEALADNRIVPFYQPIVDTKSGKIERYEALVRLIEPNGTVISPFFFLEISKKAKLYGQITKTVISKSLKKFENSKYGVSINISTEDILSIGMQEFIIDQLESYGDSVKVIFEIVESDGIQNYEEVSIFIAKVKERGAKIAVDDFGTGYSNFEHLLKLNIDYIKIDGSLIKNITHDKNSKIVVETIVSFAKKLDIKTVAEFVHSSAVLQKIDAMGIDYAQGFYISEPKEELSDRPYLP